MNVPKASNTNIVVLLERLTWHLIAQIAVYVEQVTICPCTPRLPARHALLTPIHGHFFTDAAHLRVYSLSVREVC